MLNRLMPKALFERDDPPAASAVYIHVPFCLKKCDYCDFYSIPLEKGLICSQKYDRNFTDAVIMELNSRIVSWPHQGAVDSIYFGGGTPSLLSPLSLLKMIDAVKKQTNLSPRAEITLEANPATVRELKTFSEHKKAGINRFSLGFQSSHDAALKWLGRIHDGKMAIATVEAAAKHGFDHFSADVIFGIPGLPIGCILDDLKFLIDSGVDHLSAYQLTIEEGTPLRRRMESSDFSRLEEDFLLDSYRAIVDFLQSRGFEHYEVSNFARPGCRSRHNQAYWSGSPYLGLGPGAHGLFWKSEKAPLVAERRANKADWESYHQALRTGAEPPHEMETVAGASLLAERLLLGLRVKEGLLIDPTLYGVEIKQEIIDELTSGGFLEAAREEGLPRLRATSRGWEILDAIVTKLAASLVAL
jgi:oxygen-independent coproporphyrinogen-3 oxidase